MADGRHNHIQTKSDEAIRHYCFTFAVPEIQGMLPRDRDMNPCNTGDNEMRVGFPQAGLFMKGTKEEQDSNKTPTS